MKLDVRRGELRSADDAHRLRLQRRWPPYPADERCPGLGSDVRRVQLAFRHYGALLTTTKYVIEISRKGKLGALTIQDR